jgi:O-antigen/teichoic acid export membrane protein
VLQSIFGGFQRYDYNAYVLIGSNPLRLVLIIILLFLGFGIREMMVLHIAILLLGVLIGLGLLRRLMPLKSLFSPLLLDAGMRKRALKYALTMAGVIVIYYLLYQLTEVFFIGLYCPIEEVGFYNIAARLASMSMTLIPTAFTFVLLPAIAEQFGKGDMEKIKTINNISVRYLIIVALFLSAIQISLARPIITLLYGADYAPSVMLMQILTLPFALGSIAQVSSAVISGINQPGYILKTGVFLVLLSIGLDLWLIPRYGVTGAAVASSVSRFLSLPLYTVFTSRKTGGTWPVMDSIKITLISAVMGVGLFFIQSHLGIVLSLVVGIPAGVAIYVIGILACRIIRKEDMDILRKTETSIPHVLRKGYIAIINFVEKFIGQGGSSQPTIAKKG